MEWAKTETQVVYRWNRPVKDSQFQEFSPQNYAREYDMEIEQADRWCEQGWGLAEK